LFDIFFVIELLIFYLVCKGNKKNAVTETNR